MKFFGRGCSLELLQGFVGNLKLKLIKSIVVCKCTSILNFSNNVHEKDNEYHKFLATS